MTIFHVDEVCMHELKLTETQCKLLIWIKKFRTESSRYKCCCNNQLAAHLRLFVYIYIYEKKWKHISGWLPEACVKCISKWSQKTVNEKRMRDGLSLTGQVDRRIPTNNMQQPRCSDGTGPKPAEPHPLVRKEVLSISSLYSHGVNIQMSMR